MQVFIAWKEEFFWFLSVAPNSKAACGKGEPWRELRGGRIGTSRAVQGAPTSALKPSWGWISPAGTDLILPGPGCPPKHTSSLSWVMCPCRRHHAASPATKVKPILQEPGLGKSPAQFPPEWVLLQQALNHLRLPQNPSNIPHLSPLPFLALVPPVLPGTARETALLITSPVAIAGETLPKNLLKSCLESGWNCLWIAELKPRLSLLPHAWFANCFLVWLSPPLVSPPHTSAISSFFHEQALRGSAHLFVSTSLLYRQFSGLAEDTYVLHIFKYVYCLFKYFKATVFLLVSFIRYYSRNSLQVQPKLTGQFKQAVRQNN